MPILPVILQGHSLQLMDSELETPKIPALSSNLYGLCLRDCFLYFNYRRNRNLLDLSIHSGFNPFVPWAFLEVFFYAFDFPISRAKSCYHEDKIYSFTSEVVSSVLCHNEQRCSQAEMRQKSHLHLRLVFLNISFHKNSLFCIFYKIKVV